MPEVIKDGTLIGVILTQLAIIGVLIAFFIKQRKNEKGIPDEVLEAHKALVEVHKDNAKYYALTTERMIQVVTANNIAIESNTESNKELQSAFGSLRDMVMQNIRGATR